MMFTTPSVDQINQQLAVQAAIGPDLSSLPEALGYLS